MGLNQESILIERVKAGDLRHFRLLFEKNKEQVYRICLRYMKNPDDAMDCVQETFIKAYQSIDRFRGESSFSSWLIRIAINYCLNQTRNVNTRKRLDTEYEEEIQLNFKLFEFPDPDSTLLKNELREKIKEVLNECSDRERMIFVMKHFEDYKINEISQMFGISDGTVKSTLFKTVRKLRKKLGNYFQYSNNGKTK